MMIPGSNLLNQASKLIGLASLQYIAFIGRTTQPTGELVANYADPVCVRGSFQPMSRNLMQFLGLDMQRSYANIYISQKVLDVQRDVSSDQFKYRGATYAVLSITPWHSVDGWNEVLAVKQ